MWVKVCGITRPEDARLAADCGASAIGFVFWPRSPRFVEPEAAREIRKALPAGFFTVGVFVNQEVVEVTAISEHVGLAAIQLHGDELPERYSGIGPRLIKAIPAGLLPPDEIVRRIPPGVLVLVDAADPYRRGGTGAIANWQAASAIAARRDTILAGGLTPWNVAEAIAAVHPAGVDVSSGVEAAPGMKDAGLLRRFLEATSTAASGGDRP
jgi:phosphoribosylanthranilate isomerase